MDDLLDEFVAEARELLARLSEEIVAWENDPLDSERLGEIFRVVHTIKGNCGFFDLPQLEALSHAAEEVLADCRAGRRVPDAALVSAVLAVIDRIGELVEALADGSAIGFDGDEALVEALAADSEACPSPANQKPHEQTGAPQPATPRTIRVPIELLDRIMLGVSDLALARGQLARQLHEDERNGAEFKRLTATLEDLSLAVSGVRMQRIETLFAGFPRLVRDLSQELGKPVALEIENGDVEIDRELVEVVRDPLVHVIRNAIDHGIEPQAIRRAAGKPDTGTLTISARQTGSVIRIGVVDDGGGIDGKMLVTRAIAAGLLSEAEAARLTDRQRNLLICEPGLSTAGAVTKISGRGVGMDLVKASLERIGGALTIDSTPGAGTRMMLDIPLTLSVVPSLVLEASGQSFALPRSYVAEVVHVESAAIPCTRLGGREFIDLRGRQVPCTSLGEVLDLPTSDLDERLHVLIKLVGGDLFALVVDAVTAHEDLVIKPLPPVLREAECYVGITQLSDGAPLPMLDVGALARCAGMIGDVQRTVLTGDADASAQERPLATALLFTRCDGQEQAVAIEALERIERVAASAIRRSEEGTAHVVLDDTLVPLAGLAGKIEGDTVGLLRIDGNGDKALLAFAEVIDLVTFDPRDTLEDEGHCLALIDGRPVALLDPATFVAQSHRAPASETTQ